MKSGASSVSKIGYFSCRILGSRLPRADSLAGDFLWYANEVNSMFRWVTLSIVLHALVLLVFTEFLPSTVTSSSRGQLAIIEALLQRKQETLSPKLLDVAGGVKPKLSAAKKAQPGPKAVMPTVEKNSPVAPEPVESIVITGIARGAAQVEVARAKPLESISQDGLREYRLNLSREARRHKRYPALARQRGLEGVVIVMVSTRAGLPVPQVSLSRSSGQEVLDQQALEILGLAVRAASLPDSLRSRDFAIDLPIHFSLDE